LQKLKLEEIGFAWSAKHIRDKSTNPSDTKKRIETKNYPTPMNDTALVDRGTSSRPFMSLMSGDGGRMNTVDQNMGQERLSFDQASPQQQLHTLAE
jgi:hypothetical protein